MFKIKNLNICDFFVGLWILYYMQGLLYPQGIINQMIQLLMILLGLWALVNYFLGNSPCGILSTTSLLVLMYTIYGGLIILYGDGIMWTEDSTYLKNSFNSLLPIFFFYSQAKNGRLTEKRIRLYALFILVCVIINYFYYKQSLLTKLAVEETTNNIGYMFITLLPFVFFMKDKPLLQFSILSIIMIFVLMSMKRGAIAIGAIAVVIFLFSQFKTGTGRRKSYISLLSILIVLGTVSTVSYMLETSDYFVSRVESTMEGNTSNRDHIYGSVWDAIRNEQNILPILFGHGANSTIKYAGNFAHQDWLETACNNGLLGVIFLLSFFVSFGNAARNSKRYLPSYMYYSFITVFVISISKTMFSMSIQNFEMYQGMLIGYFAYWTSKKGRMQIMGQTVHS